MKRRVGTSGFTIVETMIVLAVTGGLFVLIATTLGGRQRSNEFTQSINDVRTRIQQTISEIQNGYYPSRNDFKCSASGPNVRIETPAPNQQGTNNACVFLGKVMQFSVSGAPAAEVRVYPVAGLRVPPPPGDLASADPSVVNNASVDETTTFDLKYGLKVVAMKANGTSIGAFGVLSSLDSSNPGKSGDQQFSTYPVNVGLNSAKIQDVPGTPLPLGAANPSGGVKICFESGGTDQYGLVTVGDNSGQMSVELKIISKASVGTPCGI